MTTEGLHCHCHRVGGHPTDLGGAHLTDPRFTLLISTALPLPLPQGNAVAIDGLQLVTTTAVCWGSPPECGCEGALEAESVRGEGG